MCIKFVQTIFLRNGIICPELPPSLVMLECTGQILLAIAASELALKMAPFLVARAPIGCG